MISTLVMLVALSVPNAGQVDDLDVYGLSDVVVMSDADGEAIRGKLFFSSPSYSFTGWNVSGSLSFGGAGGSSSISGFGMVSGWTFGGFLSEVN